MRRFGYRLMSACHSFRMTSQTNIQELTMPTLEHAITLAVKIHQGQLDKYGQPYILHPLRVMFRLETELEQMVGILHDVVEDSDLTFADLRQMGYSEAARPSRCPAGSSWPIWRITWTCAVYRSR
jgi:(p)ppGpp synthase/HD superfamily hydrolase